ncbi:MAG: hypothetical protein M0000_00040 [Actinomycetota bacterium]|nr:hypothetical protein [Actinomycetota bacterium]MDA8209311.1 hypothetical protein [Actinomycetota bacterium]
MESRQLKFDGATVEEAMAKARAACGASVRVVFAKRVARKRGMLPFGAKQRFELVVEAPSPEDFEPERLSMFASQLRQAVAAAPSASGSVTEARTRNAIASYMEASGEAAGLPAHRAEPIPPARVRLEAAPPLGGARVYGPAGSKPLAIEPRRPNWGTLSPEGEEALPTIRKERPAREGADLVSETIAGLMGLECEEATQAPVQPSVPASVLAGLISLCELPPIDRPVAVILTTGTPEGAMEFEALVDAFRIPMESAWDLRKESLRETMASGFDPELLRDHLLAGASFAAHVDPAMEDEWRSLFSPTHRVLSTLQVDGAWDTARLEAALASSPNADALAVSGDSSLFDIEALLALGLPFATLNGRPSDLAAWISIAIEAAVRQ